MSEHHVSWIDKDPISGASSSSKMAHKMHSNAKLSTPIRDMLVHAGLLWLAMNDGSIELRKRSNGKLMKRLKVSSSRVLGSPKRTFCNSLVFFSDLVWGGYSDGLIRGWKPKNGQLLFERSGHRSSVQQLVVSGSGDSLYSYDAAMKLLERDALGQVVREFELSNKWLRGVVSVTQPVSMQSQLWMVHSDGVCVWQQDRMLATLRGHAGAPVLCASEPWQGRVWTGDKEGVICIWDTQSLALIRRVKFGALPIASLTAISDDFLLAVSNGPDGGVMIAALDASGSLVKFLYPLPDKAGAVTPFTLYSAASRSCVEAQRSRYVLSQVVMDRECGRLWLSFKSPLCLQSYNLFANKLEIESVSHEIPMSPMVSSTVKEIQLRKTPRGRGKPTNLSVQFDDASHATLLASPSHNSHCHTEKQRLLELSDELESEQRKMAADKKELAAQKQLLQLELKDIQRRTDEFSAMMRAEQGQLAERRQFEQRIGKLQQELLDAQSKGSKLKEVCHAQSQRLKASEHARTMHEYQLKTMRTQLSEMKAVRVKRQAEGDRVQQLVAANAQKAREFAACAQDKDARLLLSDERYNAARLESDALQTQNRGLMEQVTQLLAISKNAKETVARLELQARAHAEHEEQCEEFMRSLMEHCHGSSHDAMRPPPLSELKCFAQKSSALLSWLDRHENKMAQKLVLCDEALTAWQRKWARAEQEHEDVRTQSNAQQAQMQRLEHELIAASTKHECCLEEQQEAVSDNQHMAQQQAALRGRLQCALQELEAKSATMQRMMERIKSLQIEAAEKQPLQVRVKQQWLELAEKTEECEATHLNYVRLKMEHSALKQDMDKLKARHLLEKTRGAESRRAKLELLKENSFLETDLNALKQKSVLSEANLNRMHCANAEALSEAKQRIHGLQNENKILIEMNTTH